MSQVKDPGDTLVIHNIDVDCNDKTIEYRKKIQYNKWDTFQDQIPNSDVDFEEDVPQEFNHSEGFEVMYGGVIYGIRPGETRSFPRYIGEHYAKHLIDHLLQKEGEKVNNPNLINDPQRRAELVDKIIIDTQFLNTDYKEVKAQPNKYGDVLPGSNMDSSDLGSKTLKEEEIEYVDPLIGNVEITPESNVTLEDLKESDPNDTVEVGENVKSRVELMAECKVLGIPVQRTDKARDLLAKIKAF